MKRINFPCARYFHFINCCLKKTIHIIFMMIILMNGNSFAKIITVDDDGPADFATIQKAIDHANDNDTISVSPGTYNECLDLSNKSISLIGASSDNTIIKCNKNYSIAIFGKGNYVIKNFSITSDVTINGIQVTSATIENNVIKNVLTGISIDSGLIKDNTIENNRVGVVIRIGTIINNLIKNNGDGISYHKNVQLNNYLMIKNNEIYGNDNGISYIITSPEYLDSIIISGNTFHNNFSGIYYNYPVPTQKSFNKTDSISSYLIDAKWNWWGTTLEDSIANSIFDHNDMGDNSAVVDFSEWLLEQQQTNSQPDTIGIHYNNFINNTNFNVFATIPVVSAIEKGELKKIDESFYLYQNYPNPFNPSTTITYQLPKNGNVTLKIFDILGNEVKTLVNEQKEMGRYTVHFDASSLASGMYIYRLRANDYTSTKKMLLLK